jgi:hypothetical protein
MEKSHYELLKKSDFAIHSSWAIWNLAKGKHNEHVIDTIDESISKLNPEIIFVGYNPNGKESDNKSPWHIFHSKYRGCRDGWMMEALNTEVFRGAFLTDLFPEEKAPRISETNINETKAISALKSFEEQLNLIQCKYPYIIPIGQDAYKILAGFKPTSGIKFTLDKGIPHFTQHVPKPQKETWLSEVNKAEKRFLKFEKRIV